MTALPDEQARTLAGYKAALHNPRVSEGAKDHAAQVLREAGVEEPGGGLAHHHHGTHAHMDHDEAATHERHVVGGYKSTLSNPRTSDKAKEHAAHVLEQVASGQPLQMDEHERHVLDGYMSIINSSRLPEETKRSAQIACYDKAKSILRDGKADAQAKEAARQTLADLGF